MNFCLTNLEQPLTEELIKQTQKILTENTIKFSKGYEPGEYTDTQMAAGDTVFGDYKVNIARITVFFAETAIGRMQKEMDQKKNLTQNFNMSFKPRKKE
ncbi:hypothetical protein [Pedobacter cryoconitis]|uniref:Uncharacterized protein n=1 Tax=Pedobacter cryoconitis TaxID=188932 RepID=A0A7X0MI72_9SPHI|nr:hypothetical protein [Pedobacter cryoconitis]MBB6498153.1 hypothetical protein [Pedobacter cryoconitis]